MEEEKHINVLSDFNLIKKARVREQKAIELI